MKSLGNDNHGFNDEEGKPKEMVEGFTVEEKTWKKTKTKWTCCQISLLTLSLVSVVLGIVFLISFPYIFDAVLHSRMEVVPGSFSYSLWHYTPVPIYLRFYLFNITNPDEFQAGERAVLEELGPYVYREYHEKKNMIFNENDTVTYLQERWWVWDQEASGNNTQDDVVTILNTVPVSAAWTVKDVPLMPTWLNTFFNLVQEKLIVNVRVREVLFEGFTDPVLTVAQNLTNGSFPSFLPAGLEDYDKFGWFYLRNESLTYDGLFNMYTGHDTLDHLGLIGAWNDANTTDYFDYPCNVVNGSAGEMWPPDQQKDQVSLFSPDLCMTMTLYYKEETRDKNNLPAYRYWGTNATLPGDGCYCINNVCGPVGTLNAESCRMGAPAYISFPHFLHADTSLLDSVEGMSPSPDKHAFVLDLIPEVGIPVHVMARMQINMLVSPYRKIDMMKDVTEVYLPLLWFEEEAEMPHYLAWQLKLLLYIMNTPIINIIFAVVVALGFLGSVLVLVYRWRKAKRRAVGVSPTSIIILPDT